MASLMAGLWLGSLVLTAIGWFALGWVARGVENRRYAESRLRCLASQVVEERWGSVAGSRTCVDSERLGGPTSPMVNVYLAAPGVPVSPCSPVVGSIAAVGRLEEHPLGVVTGGRQS